MRATERQPSQRFARDTAAKIPTKLSRLNVTFDRRDRFEQVSGLAAQTVAEHRTVAETCAKNVLGCVSTGILREPLHYIASKLNIVHASLHGCATATISARIPGARIEFIEVPSVLTTLVVAIRRTTSCGGLRGCTVR
jgi:hypothetical protein